MIKKRNIQPIPSFFIYTIVVLEILRWYNCFKRLYLSLSRKYFSVCSCLIFSPSNASNPLNIALISVSFILVGNAKILILSNLDSGFSLNSVLCLIMEVCKFFITKLLTLLQDLYILTIICLLT